LRLTTLLVLLNRLLMTLLERLHLLLLLMTSMDRFSNWTTDRTAYVLTTMVMTQHVSRTDTMRYKTLLILTFGNVLPQSLHSGTVWSDGTPTILVLTFSSMTQQQETLLLMSKYLLTI